MTTSYIHCGTPENFERVRTAILNLRIDRVRMNRVTMEIHVEVPDGTNPDEHQDALTSLANAVTA